MEGAAAAAAAVTETETATGTGTAVWCFARAVRIEGGCIFTSFPRCCCHQSAHGQYNNNQALTCTVTRFSHAAAAPPATACFCCSLLACVCGGVRVAAATLCPPPSSSSGARWASGMTGVELALSRIRTRDEAASGEENCRIIEVCSEPGDDFGGGAAAEVGAAR